MKQVININFHGQVVPIEVTAFDILKKYTESLSNHFANEEGKDEIINDIESRIAELFQARIKKGSTCITDNDVNAIVKSMGRPEDFESMDEGNTPNNVSFSQSNTSIPNSGTIVTTKRLYRNENEKVIAGVCSGIGNYFGVDPVIIRVAFILITMALGTGLLAYIILWVVVPSTTAKEIDGVKKRLYRNTDTKIIAGICSGIGNYFDINAWIPRAIFLMPFLGFIFRFLDFPFGDFPNFLQISFSPGATLIYIILWIVIPEAITTAEKLQMKGEKVDMHSIKNSVIEEMKEVQQRSQKYTAEAKNNLQEKAAIMGSEINSFTKKNSSSLGDIIATLVKLFVYGIIGIVALSLVISLFSFAIATISIFPLKDFLLKSGWQNIFAWGTMIFFIAVPTIGIIAWIIRRFIKTNSNRKLLRFSFASMWIIGWVCFIALLVSVFYDFKSMNSTAVQSVVLINPTVQSLELIGNDDLHQPNHLSKWYNSSSLLNFNDEDTFYVGNVHCRIVQSSTDNFQVFIVKISNGKNKEEAEKFANQIDYTPTQKNEMLQMPVGIAIDKNNKFRNQHIIMTIAVPVGKKIKINQSIWDSPQGKINISIDNNNWDDYYGNEERGWTTNVQYKMEKDGLHNLNGEPVSSGQNKVNINDKGIEINEGKSHIIIDENGININSDHDEDKKQQQLDSLDNRHDIEKDSIDNLIEQKQRTEKEKLLHQTTMPSTTINLIKLSMRNSFM